MRIQPWEKRRLCRIMQVYFASGIVGMLAMGLVSLLFRWMGWGSVALGMSFIPWMVCAMLGIPIAFHRGVELERNRRGQGDEPGE